MLRGLGYKHYFLIHWNRNFFNFKFFLRSINPQFLSKKMLYSFELFINYILQVKVLSMGLLGNLLGS